MQKLINNPDAFVDEMLEGVMLAHSQQLRLGGARRTVLRADAPIAGKVGIATGGGSGHLPTFMGYVGPGLVDGAAVGNVFASPSSDQMLAVARAVDAGCGVLFVYGNYSGDVMNFGLAAELAKAEGIEVETVLATDDVASAPVGEETRRRGIAGLFFLYKVAGAPAAAGRSLAEVRRGPLETADVITDYLVATILQELPHQGGDRVDVLVNSLGATPVEELYIVFRRAAKCLHDAGLVVRRAWVGEYATSLEMAGASVSLLIVDDELGGLLDAPASSPFLTRL